MSIRQLPEDVVGKIKSSTVIVSLNGVVGGLLKNALDAGATKVNITVDYSRGNCTIEDNGCGIPPAEFKSDGGLTKLHHTSKHPPDDDVHGRAGNFLASVATLSLLSVSSRSQAHVSHSFMLVHNGQAIARHVPSPSEQKLRAFDHGTRVMVRDLFGSMPVRVKQRPVASVDRANVDRDWSQLIQDAMALLLAWQTPVSILLSEANGQRQVRLRSTDKPGTPARVSQLLMQSSLVDPSDVESLISVSASTSHVRITGCMSTRPVATRRAQFISFGVQPLANDRGTNVLYEEVNKVFLESSFGMIDSDLEDSNSDDLSRKERGSRRRAERWPMFYLCIKARDSAVSHDLEDILDDRGNHLSTILDLLKAVCYSFLKKHHFRPKKVAMAKDGSRNGSSERSRSTAKRSRSMGRRNTAHPASENRLQSSYGAFIELQSSNRQSPFDGWQRTKADSAAAAEVAGKIDSPGINFEDPNQRAGSRLVGEGGRLLRKPFADPEDLALDDALQQSDHFSGPRFSSNTESQPSANASRVTPNTDSFIGQDSLASGSIASRPKAQPSAWLQHVQDSWENPVFENAPPPIPRLHEELRQPPDDIRTGVCSKFFGNGGHECGVSFEAGSVSFEGRISKSALTEAEVIAQVDRKFILIKLPLSDDKDANHVSATESLIMLDQHAADERCKLEDLMADYFVREAAGTAYNTIRAGVESLAKPFLFEVTSQELELLQQYQSYFIAWGIVYEVQHRRRKTSDPASQIKITALPPSIIERCSSEPKLLIDLLRRECWELSESRRRPTAPFLPFVSEGTWISNFHRCPRGILDLLHSRACRSAIMFNDVLSNQECERLLERLSRCTFPFQCAHGRPSMAPLVDLGLGSRVGGWDEETRALRWKKWMGG